MRAAVGCLMLAAVACSNPIGPGGHVAAGTWGGEHVTLEVTADRGRIEYDCAHGDAEPLTVDRSGRFDVTGTHTPEHGGPVREDEKLISRPARYAGRVEGGRMTLTVTLTDTGEILGTFALTQGVAGRLTKCLWEFRWLNDLVKVADEFEARSRDELAHPWRNQTRLTNHVGIDQYPDWSPNGKAIAFRRNTDVYTLDLTDPSGTPLQLTIVGPVNQMPAWSPNGRQLAFMSTRAGYCSVFVMNADGTEQTNLTPKNPSDLDGDWCSRAPSWPRNGRQIYFSSFRPATHGIFRAFVMNADGTGVLQLTGTEVPTPKPGPDDSVRPR